ncbi:UNVERIFIED_CONTAM: hypothetical protein FKN15_029305 [Acipenser sinensis]
MGEGGAPNAAEGLAGAPNAAEGLAELADEAAPVNSACLLCKVQGWDAAQIEQNVSSPKTEEACCIPKYLTHNRCLSCGGSIPPQDVQWWNLDMVLPGDSAVGVSEPRCIKVWEGAEGLSTEAPKVPRAL